MNKKNEVNTIDNTIFDSLSKEPDTNYITLILNRPLDRLQLERIAKISDTFICVDGGSNRLFDLGSSIIPRVIVGDLDSIKPDVREYYEKTQNVEIWQNSSQDDTDLEKSINCLFEKDFFEKSGEQRKSKLRIFILGAFGGRLDQTISNMSNLVKINRIFEDKQPYEQCFIQMMDEYSLATCLINGEYNYTKAVDFEMIKGVGVLPLGDFNQDVILSKGLRWELDDCRFEFGKFISTSNEFQAKDSSVYIKTNKPIFFITSLRSAE